MEIWVFFVDGMFIAKRDASFYKHTTMDIKTGEDCIELIEGRAISLPKWEWVREINNQWIAKYKDHYYNINDLV